LSGTEPRYQITFHASPSDPYLLGTVKVYDGSSGSGTLIKEVSYVYHMDSSAYHADTGTDWDLIQVKVRTRNTDGTYDEDYTQYRYYQALDGSTNSVVGKLKSVFEPDAVARMVTAGSITATNLLKEADTKALDGTALSAFASRSFEYYTANDSTTDLHSTFGGKDYGEEHMFSVKSETVSSGACCGSTSSGYKRVYRYMYPAAEPESGYQYKFQSKIMDFGPTNVNQVTLLVVEDTVYRDDQDVQQTAYRTVFGVNDYGHKLRQVTIADTLYWGESWVYTTSTPLHRIAEHRMPSAHNISSTNVDEFLVPYDSYSSGGWANDTATLRNTDGLINVFKHNSNGYLTDVLIKKGRQSDTNPSDATVPTAAKYVEAYDYSYAANTSWMRRGIATASHTYPTETSSRTSSTRATTSYAITFGTGNDPDHIKQVVTTLPVVSSAENGSDNSAKMAEYFDDVGRLRWSGYRVVSSPAKDLHIKYFAYHPVFDAVVYTARDVDPASMPTGTDGNTDRWGDKSSSGASSNKPTRQSGQPTAIAATSAIELDALGRVHRELPAGSNPGETTENYSHYTIYGSNQTTRVMYWDETGHDSKLPIQVRLSDDAGRTKEAYSVRPKNSSNTSNITQSGGAPTGVSSMQSEFVRWNKNTYDSVSGWLASKTQYHDIHPTTSGTLGTNYYETLFTYDLRGRLDETKRFVSTGKYQITQSIYDSLDRVTETQAIVGSSTAVPTKSISKTQYDNDVVGDGRVTRQVQYYDDSNYTGTEFKRDFRGFVRGVRSVKNTSGVGPYVVQDVDWQGQTTAKATYVTEPNWTTVVVDPDFAATVTSGRRRLDETFYGKAGRAYRMKIHLVNQTSGASLGYRQFDQFYDYRGNLVANREKYSGGQEFAYNGLGRQYQ